MAWDAGSDFRPFCSERCKLIDLGGWLTERHAIPGQPANDAQPEDEEEPGERGSRDPGVREI